jgi:YHS domain-containing protein
MKRTAIILALGAAFIAVSALVSGCKTRECWKEREMRERHMMPMGECPCRGARMWECRECGMRTAECPHCGSMMTMRPMMGQMGMGMCPMCGAQMNPMRMHEMMEKMKMMQGKEMKMQMNCPVSGMPIDKKFYADHTGKRIYFCSAACIDEFKKDPDKHMKKMMDEGVTPEPAPEQPAP